MNTYFNKNNLYFIAFLKKYMNTPSTQYNAYKIQIYLTAPVQLMPACFDLF